MRLTAEDLAELRALAELVADDHDRLLPMLGSTVLALLDMIEESAIDSAGPWPDELTAMGFATDS
jgi:hypothetical protein